MTQVQFIEDQHGEPIFAVVPINLYKQMALENPKANLQEKSLLSSDGRYVKLPHAGKDGKLDVLRLATLLKEACVESLSIGARAMTLDKYPPAERNSLDPIIRRLLLPQDSPYKNTMQATTAVVDALVETGLFERATLSYPWYYRPVKSLKINAQATRDFIKRHPNLPADQRVDPMEIY
ncbi:hypothetical protein [Delftia acidovorans]|uniref:hypothetical protein n=1 Tax=Delftia acidovorans TaxID=80866 RepID=UPI0028AB7680|nr:hypothetical protein [Delftia acidovorans]